MMLTSMDKQSRQIRCDYIVSGLDAALIANTTPHRVVLQVTVYGRLVADSLMTLQCIQDKQDRSDYNLALTPIGTILSSAPSA